MYLVNEDGRIRDEVVTAINQHLGDRGKATQVDDRIEVNIFNGFGSEVKGVPGKTADGIQICGGGFIKSIDGMKFEITIKKKA